MYITEKEAQALHEAVECIDGLAGSADDPDYWFGLVRKLDKVSEKAQKDVARRKIKKRKQ